MIEWVLAVGTGLTAGVFHVVTGPDHMAAVLPFAVDAPKRSVWLGVLWGIGHGLGVVALGLIFMALRGAEIVEWISGVSELVVGVLLVALGLWALRRSRLVVVHHHHHDHRPTTAAEKPHAHPHVHFNDPTVGEVLHSVAGRHQTHHHSTVGFGFIHGLAGAGHLIVASPILALGTAASIVYLVSYLLGGMGAMMVFAYCAGALVRRTEWVPRALRYAGAASVLIGVFWVTSFALA